MRRHRRRRYRRNLILSWVMLIGVTVLAITAVIMCARLFRPHDSVKLDLPDATAASSVMLAAATTDTADGTPASTADPAAAPTSEPTAEPTAAPTATPQPAATILPVLASVTTDVKVIAITVDDCFQAGNLQKILDVCQSTGARITIFPIGKNLADSGVADQIRRAYQMGMEIENHSYSHAKLYEMSDEEMATEIYGEQLTVSKLLGVKYQMHFMRTRGGDNRDDPRTHAYIAQIGYYAMAHWNFTGSQSSLSEIKSALKPGTIYLFHTIDSDLANLEKFIPYAISQGYQLVTLNELAGYPANETAPLPEEGDSYYEIPQPAPYSVTSYRILKKGAFARDVYIMQERLLELGYLQYEKATGFYGDLTVESVLAFQKNNSLSPDGIAGVETQTRLYSDTAVNASGSVQAMSK